MKIKIRAFGYLAEILNSNIIELESGSDLNSLKKELERKFPDITKYEFKIAVNQEIVHGNISIDENSEIVLLPAFAGG